MILLCLMSSSLINLYNFQKGIFFYLNSAPSTIAVGRKGKKRRREGEGREGEGREKEGREGGREEQGNEGRILQHSPQTC